MGECSSSNRECSVSTWQTAVRSQYRKDSHGRCEDCVPNDGRGGPVCVHGYGGRDTGTGLGWNNEVRMKDGGESIVRQGGEPRSLKMKAWSFGAVLAEAALPAKGGFVATLTKHNFDEARKLG